MLWADNRSSSPINYFSALMQLKSLERRLYKNSAFKNSYDQTITSDLEESYTAEVDKKDCFEAKCPREWYLPHHPVFYPHIPDKVRRVFNGAAKFYRLCLNNALLTGPDFVQNLIHVLIGFHQYQSAIFARIESIFLQVSDITQDQPALHFLWLKKLLCTNTCVTFLEPKIRLHALFMRSNGTKPTKYSRFTKALVACKTKFTWTTTLS